MPLDFDVIVVGAGPSGTAAAYRLVRAGYKVLLLDKDRFPRVKPCGGAISIKALNLMPWSIMPAIERTVTKIGIGVKTSSRQRIAFLRSDSRICVLTVRQKFDLFNFENTMNSDAQFERLVVSKIDQRDDSVRLVTGGPTLSARFLIGADGANGAVRGLIDAGRTPYRGFAIEGIVEYPKLSHEPTAELFLGYAKNGYGWLFPKHDHVNVGIYTWDSSVSLSKEQLKRYAFDRLGTDKLESVIGFPIAFGGQIRLTNHKRVILVGDAAGFAEPVFGEGIYNAIKSGQAAASAIISFDSGHAPSLPLAYEKAIDPLRDDLCCCEDIKRLPYSCMRNPIFRTVIFPIIKTTLVRGFAAGQTTREITNSLLLSTLLRGIRASN
jgi:geranylgeranyl reductase family protein